MSSVLGKDFSPLSNNAIQGEASYSVTCLILRRFGQKRRLEGQESLMLFNEIFESNSHTRILPHTEFRWCNNGGREERGRAG